MREYLEALKTCPDESLTDRLGVHDNWPIYLKADFGKTVEDLVATGKFAVRSSLDEECWLDYIQKPVGVRVFNRLAKPLGLKIDEGIMIQNEYNMSMVVVHDPSQRGQGNQWLKSMAIAIGDIGEYVTARNIPAYFPKGKINGTSPIVHP